MSKPTQATNVILAALLLAVTGAFLYWGIDYTRGNSVPLFVLAGLFGLFMAFNIGGNDVANSFGTSVGAGTLNIKQALVIAAIFEVSGAMIAGGEVTSTIRKGIVDLSTVALSIHQFVYIMMAALLSAALWLLYASRRGYPVSTTHSIIGGIVGASLTAGAIYGGGSDALAMVKWQKIGLIAASWIISPLMGGVFAYALYLIIKRNILAYN
ncbi:MAG: inorganic phosphate transporter, partial [Polyangiaceae bacterium]|nr:inorganic phosphate transporter [Polyangiaceae bacterium]